MVATMSHVAPKRKKIAKSKKRSWKHIDVSKVEEFLEDERLQERTGGLVAEKKNEELFFVDKKVEEPDKEPVPQRKTRSVTDLKCYSNLQLDPLIKPARLAHNVKKKTTVSPKVLKQLERKVTSAAHHTARKQRWESRKEKIKRIKTRNQLPIARYDLWSDSHRPTKQPEEIDHYLAVTKKKTVKVPATYYKPTSEVPAVQVPHPGASYNPDFDDYLDLLSKADEVEQKKLKEEKKLYNALEGKFPSLSDAPTKKIWLKEMSAGLHDEKVEEEDDNVDTDPTKLSVNPPVRREDFKTKKQKRKEREHKIELKKAMKLKTKKKVENEVFRVKTLKKEIRKRETEFEKRATKKEELKEKNRFLPKRIGKHKFEEPDLEVKLTHELRGSLRLLSPEGFLLEDRFKSWQKRNIIEPRIRVKRKKTYKPKMLEKKTHKEVKL